MTVVLGFDTATPATAVAVLAHDGEPVRARHEPAPGERPAHASQLLGLCHRALEEAGLAFADVGRIAVGIGPGTFTGLRIGVATARGIAQAAGTELVGVGTLEALAAPAGDDAPAVLAVLDARRGEAYAAGYAGGVQVAPPAALPPEELAALAGGRDWLAVGDGAVRFRAALEQAGATVPPDDSGLHRVDAAAVCRLAMKRPAERPEAVLPDYLRQPDAKPR